MTFRETTQNYKNTYSLYYDTWGGPHPLKETNLAKATTPEGSWLRTEDLRSSFCCGKPFWTLEGTTWDKQSFQEKTPRDTVDKVVVLTVGVICSYKQEEA